MRLPLRSFGTLLLAVAVATCSDSPHAVVKTAPEGRAGVGRFSISPRFSPQAAAIYAQRATFAAANFDHVRIVLTRPPNEVVLDTVITFNPASPPTTLELFVDVKTTNEVFDGALQYTNNGVVVYSASGKIQSHPVDQPAPQQQELEVVYVGPGANASRLTVAPQTSSIVAPGSVSFTASAFDANNNAVTNVPISWSISDPTIATLSTTTGTTASITTTGKRGSVTVTAATPTLSASAGVTVTLPPASIVLVSGGGQTGKAGSALASPAVVQVNAADGVGVAGVSVQFAGPNGGGVGTASATTDAAGRASSSLILGSAVGPQSFAASAAGFSVSISATATPADPAALAVVSGSGQTDTVGHALKQPFVVKVSDRFGNGVGGITVTWAKTSGGGTLSGSSSVSASDGTASMGYTLGTAAGQESVTASVAGIATPATFTATAVTAPANIAAVSGGGQTGRVGQALASPFVVSVTDAAGTPVGGAIVFWSATNGTVSGGTSTNAQGQASASFTLGNTIGSASATATVNTPAGPRSASFSATVQPGIVAKISFRTGPSSVGAGVVMVPPVEVELQDAGGNRTNAVNTVTISLGANPGQATLGGTLTRSAVNGVATFGDLTVSAAGTGYTLVASSAGVQNITSSAFTVTSTAPTNRILLVDQQTFTPLPTSPPPSVTMTAGTIPTNPPAIRVVDGQGAPVTNATVSYTVTRGAQTLFSGSPQTNAQGIITFATLAISPSNMQVAGNYSFVATLSGATGSPLTLPVTVVPAAPAKYLVSAAPTTPAPGAQSTITAQLADQFDNAIAQAGNTVSWTLSGNGGGSLGAGNSATNAQGQATVVYTAPAQPSGATVTVSAIDVGNPNIVGQVTLTPQTVPIGPAAKLAIVTQPSATAVSLQPLAQQPVIQVQDANGNAVPTPTPIQIVAVWTAQGGSERNNLASTNAQGVATFTSLAVVGSGTAPLTFSASGLTSVSSNNVTSTVPATALQFLVQPTNVFVNSPFSPAVQVRVVDANNNTVTTANVTVTMAIGTNPANGGLAGNVTVNTVNGVATFTNININTAGSGYTLTASATGLTSATSNAFDVLLVPNAFAFVSIPTSVVNDVPFSPPVVVRLTRSGSNVPLAGITVTATDVPSISSRPPAANSRAAAAAAGRRNKSSRQSSMASPANVLTNRTAVTDANGIATFSGMTLTGSIQYFRLAFDAQGPGFVLTDTTSDIFLDAGAATSIAILTGDAQSGVQGQPLPFDPTVALVDISGNYTVGPATTVTFATTTGSVNPTSVVTDQNGFASTQWTMPSSLGSASMTASATINGTPTTVTFTATSTTAPPATLTFVTPQLTTTPVGTPLPTTSYPRIRVLDQTGAPVANQLVTFSTAGSTACTIPNGSVVVATDATGEAGLSTSNFSFSSAAAGSCWVFAIPSNSGLFGQFSVMAVPANTKVWTGAGTRAWTDAGSWLPNGVPTATDAVFIPAAPLQPAQVTTAVSTGPVNVEQTAAQIVTLFSNATLTINGSLDAGAAGGIFASTGNGAFVILNASGPTATLSGNLSAATRVGAGAGCTTTYSVVNFFTIWNPIVNCPIDIGSTAMNVSGALTVQNSGRIIMTQPQAVLLVGSDATFQGASEAGFLTAGAISINGQLRINNGGSSTPFVQGANTTLQLTGTTSGIIVGTNVQAFTIGTLQTVGTNNAVISSSNPITAAGLLQSGSMSIASGTTFNVTGQTFFVDGSITTISGASTLGGSVDFQGTSSVTGTGILSVTTPSTCSKKSTATVNVTGSTPAFTASAQQCTNQIP